MSPDSGHLINIKAHGLPAGYEVLPDELQGAARRHLRGRSEAYVSKDSGGRLSKWAAGRRKARRQTVKASRKRNR
jgi:hypothetical protein